MGRGNSGTRGARPKNSLGSYAANSAMSEELIQSVIREGQHGTEEWKSVGKVMERRAKAAFNSLKGVTFSEDDRIKSGGNDYYYYGDVHIGIHAVNDDGRIIYHATLTYNTPYRERFGGNASYVADYKPVGEGFPSRALLEGDGRYPMMRRSSKPRMS